MSSWRLRSFKDLYIGKIFLRLLQTQVLQRYSIKSRSDRCHIQRNPFRTSSFNRGRSRVYLDRKPSQASYIQKSFTENLWNPFTHGGSVKDPKTFFMCAMECTDRGIFKIFNRHLSQTLNRLKTFKRFNIDRGHTKVFYREKSYQVFYREKSEIFLTTS